MKQLFTIPRFWGPLVTVVFTLIYHLLATELNFTIAVGWIWLFSLLGAFIGGRRAGLISATWAALYAYYAMPPGDWTITIQRVIIGYLMVGIVGWETHRLRQFYKDADELLNGNAEKLREGLKFLREAKDEISDARHRIELSEDKFGNLLSIIFGYTALRDRIREVNEWHRSAENIQRLQSADEIGPENMRIEQERLEQILNLSDPALTAAILLKMGWRVKPPAGKKTRPLE